MSHRSALWSAIALTAVFMLLFGAVLLRPAFGDSANAGQPAATVVVDNSQNGNNADDIADNVNTYQDDSQVHEDDHEGSENDNHEEGGDDD